jgi:membrane protein
MTASSPILSVLIENSCVPIGGRTRRLALRDQGTLGLGAAAGVVAALWSVNRAMRSLLRVLDRVHGRRETRGFLARTALSLGFTLGSILFALSALSTVVAVPLALDLTGLGGAVDLLLRLLRWPLLLGATTVLLACIYRYGSCRAAGHWQ